MKPKVQAMIPYKWPVQASAPQTLAKRLEIAQAIRAIAASEEDERLRRKRAEIACIRRDFSALALATHEPQRACDPRLRSYVLKARPDDPEHPGWSAGAPDGRGGKFRPKDDENGDGIGGAGAQYAGDPYYPPAPQGYDPNTWKQGQWPNNKYYLQDPEGNTYTVHPEDRGHWRHWDKEDNDGNDQGMWPPNSKKPWPGQKRPDEDQSTSDPNGDAPSWTPNPFVPVTPVDPIPFPDLVLPPIFVPG